jgi:peptidoglycan/xylan/chitin deacetylase (PgdA/CDA1 family)
MADIKVVLTFDDGPRPDRTDRVLATLGAPGDGLDAIKAAFFVQTHSPVGMASKRGPGLVKQTYEAGHLIGIHTGSTKDHTCHKNRVKSPADPLPSDLPKAANGLDSDMIRAKAVITKVTTAVPKYVRATFGYTNADCLKVYGARLLKHIYWDVASGDADKDSTLATINDNLRKGIIENVRKGQYNLIILFHDPHPITAAHLGEFIRTIKAAAESAKPITSPTPVRTSSTAAIASSVSTVASSADGGSKTSSQTIPLSSTATASDAGVSKNTVSRTEIEDIFDRRARPGVDLPCPPGY